MSEQHVIYIDHANFVFGKACMVIKGRYTFRSDTKTVVTIRYERVSSLTHNMHNNGESGLVDFTVGDVRYYVNPSEGTAVADVSAEISRHMENTHV